MDQPAQGLNTSFEYNIGSSRSGRLWIPSYASASHGEIALDDKCLDHIKTREYYLLDIWTKRDYSEIGIEEEIRVRNT